MSARPLARLTAALLGATLLVTACSGDDGDSTSAEDTSTTVAEATFPTIVTAENGDVELAEQPDRIVSLSASLTEMLYAVGAGEQVVAVDKYSDFPEGTPVTELSGFKPNVEAIAGYEPDLVVTAGDKDGIVAALDALGVPTLVLSSAKNLDHTYEQLAILGDATGHSADADEVAAEMGREIDAIVEEVGDIEAQTYFYELSDELSTVTSETFVGSLLSLLGLQSIADDAPDAAGGYPKLTNEFVLTADPAYVFLAHAGAPTDAATVLQRPGWAELTAFADGRVVVLPADISSRWGPRVVDLLDAVAAVLTAPSGSAG